MSVSPAPAAAPASTLAVDVVAGLSIAGLLLPEAVAYSGIAGLPPQAGVIGLLVGLVCYGLFGRSRYAIVSATSSSAAVLADFAVWLSARDITLRVARLKDVVRQLLERAALPQLPASALDFWSVEDAASASVATPSTRGSGQ
ncbi:MAG: SulP family inorganic anion transporter [Rhodanobacter sp.]